MNRIGKIARLPHLLREEVNHRLQDNEPAKSILEWLNALPEVQSILQLHFAGRPISPSNLTEWKDGGYQDWCLRQDALRLVESVADKESLGDQLLTDRFNDKVAQWTSLQLAAAGRALLAAENDPKTKLSLLHQFSTDVNRLRRGDQSAERLALERQRLDFEIKERTDADFWEWSKRPDIAAKLAPPKPKGLTLESLREIEDAFCLTGSDHDRQIIGRLMRQRRLYHEGEEAKWLAWRAANYADSDQPPYKPATAGAGAPPVPNSASSEPASPSVPPDNTAAAAETPTAIAAPDGYEPFVKDVESCSFSPGPQSSAEEGGTTGFITTIHDATPADVQSFSSTSGFNDEVPMLLPTPSREVEPELAATKSRDSKSEVPESPEPDTADTIEPNTSVPQPLPLCEALVTIAAPPTVAPEFCPDCHGSLPPLNSDGERPFSHCRNCGHVVPPPGQALAQLPDSPPPYNPANHCPECSATLLPLSHDGSRLNDWCTRCDSPLPEPHENIEHCPHCGKRLPPVAPGCPRPKSTCNHCNRVLPPPLTASTSVSEGLSSIVLLTQEGHFDQF